MRERAERAISVVYHVWEKGILSVNVMIFDAGDRNPSRVEGGLQEERLETSVATANAVLMGISGKSHADCANKARYESLVDAEQAAEGALERGGVELWPYRCPFCARFHLTAQRPRREAGRRRR